MEGIRFKVTDNVPQGATTIKMSWKEHPIEKLPEYENEGCVEVMQGTELNMETFHLQKQGFVATVLQAYSSFQNLVIRPDDMWLAIVVQFGLYVNGHAEEFFVNHKGKKKIEVENPNSCESIAKETTMLLRKNIKDESLCDWVLPAFSTTTDNDKIAASVILMAALKAHKFAYDHVEMLCGIPYVTLKGTTQDWKEIDRRISMLRKYGKDCRQWAAMLKKVTSQLVQTSKGNIDSNFWSSICHVHAYGYASSTLTGWITAFCPFNRTGKWVGQANRTGMKNVRNYLSLSTDDLPPGYHCVDLIVNNTANMLMFAGHLGYDLVENGYGVAPKVGWAVARQDKTVVEKNKAQMKASGTISIGEEAKSCFWHLCGLWDLLRE